jgi:hypothetical protein
MNKIYIFVITLLSFSCSCYIKQDRPNEKILTHIMAAPRLVDRGNLDLLKVLNKDTSIIVHINGIVEKDSTFTFESFIDLKNDSYEFPIKEYIKTIKFKPGFYYSDSTKYRQIMNMKVVLMKKN